ncbi:uncharacterized protein LOC131678053 [Topomyia yanbarensis]|uniref:uncharacterized protein LOC131678053 n=1 Tax=Topomyia yanbarensis TaxID=2498891 RepID=UPI00273B1C2E|nr:uncharacterized protein LOC131678053 [Topomyia yanbarensis]XP_058814166.1 uncharacterized protein LOC131678053 [Topomyia yanbarensis]XP_058814168.1 uncharacterized protein LOC131678053 [Topomyia yanbarensis]XP_058814169.1 uncharacterized protein LOC131678053 [Topomyia yanbarensis]XP_058814170.1 uncharacterized protein LOC131678053 [Topomyia yanbarensis]XP_058814171.1 uncharacterized protein LOC131678053 [Topomyia yanbarensis]XP_058814172.1 uncharacterized protein LOC131678053 [Topomyia yan
MKRLLLSYKDGHNGSEDSRWSNNVVMQISKILKSIKLPTEIHRAVRGIDCLTHWKASECASFLHCIGIIVLKHFIKKDQFQNFANLFCAVTICSSSYYIRFLPVAQTLFEDFIANYYLFYNSITSNIHNLVHIVDEVSRFGPLPTISSYPFENHLFQVKKLVRSGKLPLNQIINRITEKYSFKSIIDEPAEFPIFKYPMKFDHSQYGYVGLTNNFMLATKFPDRWFLTKDKRIAAMQYANTNGIYGSEVNEIENLFEYPLSSPCINVFKAPSRYELLEPRMYGFDKVLCKLVVIVVLDETSFIPLLHTLPATEQQ